jgi:hypothetical protein
MTVVDTAYPLKVRIPSGFGLVMGMTYIVADNRLFTANFTDFRHLNFSFNSTIIYDGEGFDECRSGFSLNFQALRS